MLPARDQAALRPMRAVSTSRAQRPTVSAATAGSNTPLTTCIAPFASSTGQKLGAIAMTTAPIDSASRPHSMARRLCRVRSSHAPIGTCAARPSQPPTVLTSPAVVGVQPCSATRKTTT